MGGSDVRSTANDKKEIAAIRHALSLGMTHIDTAEYYGDGHAEELVAEATDGFDRNELFITTKRWHSVQHKTVALYFSEFLLSRNKPRYRRYHIRAGEEEKFCQDAIFIEVVNSSLNLSL